MSNVPIVGTSSFINRSFISRTIGPLRRGVQDVRSSFSSAGQGGPCVASECVAARNSTTSLISEIASKVTVWRRGDARNRDMSWGWATGQRDIVRSVNDVVGYRVKKSDNWVSMVTNCDNFRLVRDGMVARQNIVNNEWLGCKSS